jgi:hypothetical protein
MFEPHSCDVECHRAFGCSSPASMAFRDRKPRIVMSEARGSVLPDYALITAQTECMVLLRCAAPTFGFPRSHVADCNCRRTIHGSRVSNREWYFKSNTHRQRIDGLRLALRSQRTQAVPLLWTAFAGYHHTNALQHFNR